ncbi:MAG: M14 family zinc carboxypeptidase [Bacteroidota bacterium]
MLRLGSFLLLLFAAQCILAQRLTTPFEKGQEQETATYAEAISFYKRLAARFPERARLMTYGTTDAGKPVHLLVVSGSGVFDPEEIRTQKLPFLLINNGIHPGEPCGVDASMLTIRELLSSRKYNSVLENMVIGIIPIYNIGGALNRNSFSRTNQIGPNSYGFRGNARNYDLNRDFLKMDTENALTFAQIFHTWLPDVFIDTHTTNGADYQYTMTLIPTRTEKIGPMTTKLMEERLLPELFGLESGKLVGPYVNMVSSTPDDGLVGFFDLPRYSSGYAGLFQTMGFISEAHMLKEFPDRVEATETLIQTMVNFISENRYEVVEATRTDREACAKQTQFDIQWEIVRDSITQIPFLGYEAQYDTSNLTGQLQLSYDRSKKYTKDIRYFNFYKASKSVQKPQAYIIPQAYRAQITKLAVNGVQLDTVQRDTIMNLEVYYLEDVHTLSRPYEGHYYHDSVSVRKERQNIQLFAGDVMVYTDQWRNPFIIHTLEPEAPDSWFRWNAFDGVLMQKEYFSSYVFEPEAAQLIENNPELKKAFEEKKASDPAFAKSARAQLDFIYKRSEHYEKTHMRYPIFRL